VIIRGRAANAVGGFHRLGSLDRIFAHDPLSPESAMPRVSVEPMHQLDRSHMPGFRAEGRQNAQASMCCDVCVAMEPTAFFSPMVRSVQMVRMISCRVAQRLFAFSPLH